MYRKIDEKIEALALFQCNLKSDSGRDQLQPLRFRWNGKVYKIKEITANWQTRNGLYRTRHFTILDHSSNCYQLSFDPLNCLWKVSKVWID